MDLKKIRVSTGKPSAARALEFAEQMKNPYLFRVGDIAVSVVYCEDRSLSDALVDALRTG